MPTPLIDTLLDHIRLNPAAFHMPGHKGRMKDLEGMANIAALDVTELPDTGDLYAGGDAIEEAQELWADVWHFPYAQFLTGGSTQGVHAALLLAARRGKDIAVDRCSHKSVYNAMGLLDLRPHYLPRRQDTGLRPRELDALLREHPEIKTVCVTSPTYYGVLSDIPNLAKVAHAHGAWLVVDAAHGAHLPFIGGEPCKGADLAVTSAHKTMCAYGQGAVLFGGFGVTAADLRWAASVCGTSSPSFPILASLDYARDHLDSKRGRANMEWAVRANRALQEEFPHLEVTYGDRDPLRFVLAVNVVAAGGYEVKEWLERRNIFPEMADRDYVVFLLSGNNREEDVQQLFAALRALPAVWPEIYDPVFPPPDLPGRPEVVLSPAQALVAPRVKARLFESEGRVCLDQVAPYPPGIPVIAPGERVTKKSLVYLRDLGYNGPEDIYVLPEGEGETP